MAYIETADLASSASGKGAAMVGFKQTGAGAIGRTADAKLREFALSVDDFGAIGDDATDDYAAIVAAQTALLAQGGGELLFTRGKTYKILTPIPMRSGITYKGSGRSGINQIVAAPGAKIKVAGNSAFINHSTEPRTEIKFENLFIHAPAGDIFDWSEDGLVAKIEFVGCAFIVESPYHYVIKGTATGGVFSIWMHDCDYQYSKQNSVSPLSLYSQTINSIVIERCWSTCAYDSNTPPPTSGTVSIYFESLNAAGPCFNCIVRDVVFEVPIGGSVKMLGATESGVENCTVYDLNIPPVQPQFEFNVSSAGHPSANCWLRSVRSQVGTAAKPDALFDFSVAGQGAFVVEECSLSYLDGGTARSGLVIFGGNITNFQNIAYTRLAGSPGLDLHLGTSDALGKSYTIWNGYSGNNNGFLCINQDGTYVGGIHSLGLFSWGGTPPSPAFYVATNGEMRTKQPIYPPTFDNTFQSDTAIYAGSGAPNGAKGTDGQFYLRSDGGAGTTIYHKRAGAWVGIV